MTRLNFLFAALCLAPALSIGQTAAKPPLDGRLK